MDSAFTSIVALQDPADPFSKLGGSIVVPSGNNVAFNDALKTHRVTLSLTRIANGYNLSYAWQNLASGGTTITNAFTITTGDFDGGAAMAAGITSWDRLGFFVNADVVNGTSPWVYTLSNVGVDAVAVPEPGSIILVLFGLATIAALRVQRSASRG
jgi:hypothetical protein